jgi:uncharacterized protein
MFDTTQFNRRTILKGTAALSSLSVIAAFDGFSSKHAQATEAVIPGRSPYGPISPVKDLATGLPLLQLPKGFIYKSMGWTGDRMSNGQPVPPRHDGMAAIAVRGRSFFSNELVLIRNHENGVGAQIGNTLYDSSSVSVNGTSGTLGGGTTNIRLRGLRMESIEPSLGGTLVNCAGGATPWGTWLSCEETGLDLTENGGLKHGYVFEVSPISGRTTGRPLVGLGRFSHEAVAIDPRTNAVYLTEDDRNKSGLYRFVPNDRSGRHGCYENGGKLQAARVVGEPNASLLTPKLDDRYRIEWVDIPNPDADRAVFVASGVAANATASGPFLQAWERGALRMSRGEGAWYARGKIFFTDTSAGLDATGAIGRGDGAVWVYDIARSELRSIFVSNNPVAGNNPDNITISPRGGIVLCEDGGGVEDEFGFGDRLLGLQGDGESYIFAKNNVVLEAADIVRAGKKVEADDYRGTEFCGACFDPFGSILFVNLQSPGITFAIAGPWQRGNL